MNSVSLVGRLTRDIELKYSQQGKAFGNFVIAVNRQFTNPQGEREADFIPVKIFGNRAETCAKYIGKGSQVAVNGRIQIDKYEDKDGATRYSTNVIADNVIFLDSKKEDNGNSTTQKGFAKPPVIQDEQELTEEDISKVFGDLPFEVDDKDINPVPFEELD